MSTSRTAPVDPVTENESDITTNHDHPLVDGPEVVNNQDSTTQAVEPNVLTEAPIATPKFLGIVGGIPFYEYTRPARFRVKFLDAHITSWDQPKIEYSEEEWRKMLPIWHAERVKEHEIEYLRNEAELRSRGLPSECDRPSPEENTKQWEAIQEGIEKRWRQNNPGRTDWKPMEEGKTTVAELMAATWGI